MPQGKTRRKDDTWTTEDLTDAIKGTRGTGDDKKKRSKDDYDRKEHRQLRDDVNGDDRRRRHRDDDDKRSSSKRDEDEERERLRQERREKRGGGEPNRKENRVKEKPVGDEDDRKSRHRREEDHDRRQRKEEDDDGERRKRREDSGERKHREKKESSRPRDKGRDEQVVNEDDDERDRRRRERREKREREKKDEGGKSRDREHKSKDDDRKEKHRDREERHRGQEDRPRDRDREDRHKDRDRERDRGGKEDSRRRDKDKETREEREERKQREREERKRREREKEEEERKKREEEERKKEDGGGDADDYNEYEEDFEDYEDDFEDEQLEEPEYEPVPRKPKIIYEREPSEEGEMEEILRALDEENARLTAHSHRSNWSDSTELSDERFKEGEEPGPRGQDKENRPTKPRTFINFVSAKQRVMNQSLASKARRRANDLKNMIELDTVFYDLFDLPPVREYDLYIRSFGRSNTKQAYVQTNEDAVERDVQTEDIEDLDKWTQHPADDMAGVGGDGISVMTATTEDQTAVRSTEAIAKISRFLEQAAQVINIILEEERSSEDGGGGRSRVRKSTLSFSEGYSQLDCPPFLAGRSIQKVCFCPMQPNMFLTLHSKPEEPSGQNALDIYGMVCVWNAKDMVAPHKVLVSVSQPTCACFSPSRAALVIAGMIDGSVMLWDLREPLSFHRSVFVDGHEVITRSPTYNTAGVLEKENHSSPVTAITAVHPTVVRKEGDNSVDIESEGLSFQLASVDDNATVNLWVVTEIASPDMAGSEVDLGLAPGGRVKLLRSSAVTLNTGSIGKFRALDIQLNPSDLNHFFVGTDVGQIIHGVRFGSRVFPRLYEPEIESPRLITSLDFSPFGEPYFVVGCEDGSVHLYHTTHKHPLASWPTFTGGHSVLNVQWSRSRPAVFFALASSSVLYTFDLVETGLGPVKEDAISSGRATCFAMGNDPALISGSKHLLTHMLIGLDNGSAQLHTMNSTYRQQQPLEMDFLSHYMERF